MDAERLDGPVERDLAAVDRETARGYGVGDVAGDTEP